MIKKLSEVQKIFLFICISILIITISYLYVDRSFSFWTHEQNFARYPLLKFLTHIIEYLEVLAALFYVYIAGRLLTKKINRLDRKILVICNSMVIAAFLKEILKWVFGRYWAETWTNSNPSLINDGVYGFNFFKSGSWYQSFPSGHTAITFAATVSLWMLFPRLRWLAILISLCTVIGQLGMNFHFVSDVMAGALLGGLVAYFANRFISSTHS